jgi:predicted RNA methylase
MTLIVETGAIVSGANSYVSLADARAYASARGVTLSAVDATLEPMVIKAMDFVESHSAQFIGERVQRDQPLSWPRVGAVVERWEWASTEIPRQLINATLATVVEVAAGTDPFNPPLAALPTIKERVEGAVELAYAAPRGGDFKVAKDREALVQLRMLLRNSGLFAVRA